MERSSFASHVLGIGLIAAALVACTVEAPARSDSADGCDAGNGGLTLPEGFCASVFADNIGHARHLVVAPNGDVYVNTTSSKSHNFTAPEGGFIVALRDGNRDGRAEVVRRFGTTAVPGKPGGGTGIAMHNGALYVEADQSIVRYAIGGDLVPAAGAEIVLGDLPATGDHTAHPFAIASDGTLYVNSGSATNACQSDNRVAGSRGQQPCPELATRAGIWKYDANKTGQKFSASERIATGIRNTVALAVNPADGALFVAVNDRDQLSDNWPALYNEAQNNELPAEKFFRLESGQDYGWPYCYFDPKQQRHVLAPEYGGDGGKAVGQCGSVPAPALAFPAHWAPMALAFYTGQMFPSQYQRGAFVSFHGSWNRSPSQSGFVVAFVPFSDGKPGARYEEFARGFAGQTMPADPKAAAYRPMGVAIGPDGAMYVSDDARGRVWRISFRPSGTRESPGRPADSRSR